MTAPVFELDRVEQVIDVPEGPPSAWSSGRFEDRPSKAGRGDRVVIERQVFRLLEDPPSCLYRHRARDRRGAGRLGTVLFLHGYAQNHHTFHLPSRSCLNYFAARGAEVFAVDLRGHGRSRLLGAPRLGQGKATPMRELIEEDVPRALTAIAKLTIAEGEGPPRVALVGHSLGGLIGLGVAALHPQHVHAVAMLGSPYDFGRGSRLLGALARVAASLSRRGVGCVDPPLSLALLSPAIYGLRDAVGWVGGSVGVQGWLPGAIESTVLKEYLSHAFDAASLPLAYSLFQGAHVMGGRPSVESLLVIAGTHDRLAPPLSVRAAYEAVDATDKRYLEVPHGHIDLVVGRDAPQQVWAPVADWLADRSVASAVRRA